MFKANLKQLKEKKQKLQKWLVGLCYSMEDWRGSYVKVQGNMQAIEANLQQYKNQQKLHD